eukprot:3322015-Pyramimonas_sp.AAC.1
MAGDGATTVTRRADAARLMAPRLARGESAGLRALEDRFMPREAEPDSGISSPWLSTAITRGDGASSCTREPSVGNLKMQIRVCTPMWLMWMVFPAARRVEATVRETGGSLPYENWHCAGDPPPAASWQLPVMG